MSTFQRRSLAAVVALAGAMSLSACGAGTSGADYANGKTQFTQKCGGCHAMAAAGTKGVIGPNLDDAFRQSRSEGFKASTFEGVVRYWIANPEQRSTPKMTPNLVTGKDADDVAAYVAVSAGAPDANGKYADSAVRPPAAAK